VDGMRVVARLLLSCLCCCGGVRGVSPGRLETLGAELPHLPAPEAQIYAVRLGEPVDPLVAAVVGELPWEESLSGAAGALGMEMVRTLRPTDAWQVRWAAYRAGYPYPVQEILHQTCSRGCVAEQVLEQAQGLVQPGDHLGIARVRGGSDDLWICLLGRPRLALPPVPRALEPGGEISLTAVGGGRSERVELSLVSPSGHLEQGDLWQERRLVLGEQGEYWVQLRDPQGVLAGFPVYVGLDPFAEAPLAGWSLAADSAEELLHAGWEALDLLRSAYGLDPLEADPILSAVARAHLGDRLGREGPEAGEFGGAPASCRASLGCVIPAGAGVEACAQGWLVDPSARAALVDSRCTLAGLASEQRARELWLQLELGER